ncbi:hypothetical protein HYU50_04680 [Candidatus Woesearchaeota archaeon]|nr:hypothetical protein [Candidatus Woesearchaeota archaeon]
MDWEECCNKRIAKEAKPDEDMINSLVKSSKNKMESESKLSMDNITAASKLSLAYDSLRELLEALALKNGFKVYNHECYTAFLREVLSESHQAEEFDEIRKARNSVNYYGKEVSEQEAKEMILRIKALRALVSKLLVR